MTALLDTAWNLLCESAIFVLVGFLLAGGLHVLVSDQSVIRFLSAKKARSVFLASAVGLPLPLCSCSVLPAAITLRKKGASRGATLSFLISTPETSVASVLLTYSLLGPVMAIFRPIAACVTALTAGLVENGVERRRPSPQTVLDEESPPAASCCHPDSSAPPARRRFREALRYGLVDLFDDIAGWVLIGVLAAALIQAVLPDVLFKSIFAGSLPSMLLMLAVGVPLYVCAEASTPIAAVFIAQGLNPGAALVFLLVGPATNIGSLGALQRLLGRRTIVVYLACITVVALVMGQLLNSLLAQSDIRLAARAMRESLVPEWAKVGGALAFLVLWILSARRLRYAERLAGWLDARLPVRVTPRGLTWAAVAGLILAYLASGLFAVQPGERGVVRRFGAIRRADVPPGLHYALPYPIDTVNRVPVRRVYRTLLGFKTGEGGRITPADNPDEAWILIGDENIANIKSVAHWGGRDDRLIHFRYGVQDREKLVRDVVQSVTRELLGGRTINRVFTADRRRLERRIEAACQARLDTYESGIRIDSFCFLDAHAPPQVHDAFRDVAGALEDRATKIHRAWAEEANIIPRAEGEAARKRAEAYGYETRMVRLAAGRADRFLELLDVYRDWPAITRRRLHFETLDQILPGIPKYVKPPDRTPGNIEIWFVEPQTVGTVSLPPMPGAK